MSQPSRSCARCTRPAIVTRANAPYCLDCNILMEWSDVIAAVQAATDPDGPEAAVSLGTESAGGAALTAAAITTVEADPFAQRLA